MRIFKILLKIFWICIVAVCAFIVARHIFILCMFKDEYFEKSGTDIAQMSNIFPAKNKNIVPEEIADFSYAHQKHGWRSCVFWKGFLDKKSFEKFATGEGLVKIANPPIYDYLAEENLGIKISKPCEVYESPNTRFVYIYDASGQVVGIYNE